MRRIVFILAVVFAGGFCFAQDSTYCDPSILDAPLSKGLEISYDRLIDYGVSGTSDVNAIGDVNGEVRRNRRLKAAVKLPLLNKHAFKLIVGAKYEREQYSFQDGSFEESPVLQNIDRLPLTRTSVSLIAVKPFRGNKYFVVRVKSAINRNVDGGFQIGSGSMKYSAAAILGWKKNDRTAMGLGASLGYNLGRAAISPVIIYNRTFDQGWGLQLVLPILVSVHRHLSEKDLLLLNVQLKGANYDLDLDLGDGSKTYYLERSEVHTTLRYERELHDWLWAGVEAGMRTGLELNIVDDFGIGQGERLLNGKVRPAAEFSVGLFVVTPKKWRKE